MKMILLTRLMVLLLVSMLSVWTPVNHANAQTICDCCPLGLPAAPGNLINLTLAWSYPPMVSDSFMTATVLTNSSLPPGVYAGWCADAQTALLPGVQGYEYLGGVYASTDPNLNQHLSFDTTNASALVGPDVWKNVNYILNHRAAYNYWDVQAAIWHFVGGPAVTSPPYPSFNTNAVLQLVYDSISNAPAWCPQAGDKVAVVTALVWPVDNQIIIIEVPCPGTVPALGVSVTCPADCGLVGFSGSVSNTGNVTLTNVFVLSSQPSNGTLVLGPISLAPGAAATFTNNYTIPCITNLSTNSVSIVTTNKVGVIATNTVVVVTTNTVPVITTNTVSVVTTNLVGVVTTNVIPVITTNSVAVISTNTVGVISTNLVNLITTNTVPTTITNSLSVISTNTAPVVTTNIASVVTTNFIPLITTNSVITLTTNLGIPTFGTIDPVTGILTDRFTVPTLLHGLMYADQDENWGPTLFYSVHEPVTGANTFDTISTIPPSVGLVSNRFNLSSTNYDAMTLSAPDVGYGAVNFYYVRHDASGNSTFGVIKSAGASSSADLWNLPNGGYNALAFAAADLGYGANLFYFLRQDSSGLSTFGTINPTPGGIASDKYVVGTNFDSLVFVPSAVSTWGTSIFAYLRHDNIGSVIGTIDPVTHVVTDRLHLGTNLLSDLTFTATDVGYGPNLFYYLRPGSSIVITNTATNYVTNTVASFSTNDVTSYVTNYASSFTTNNSSSFTTNTVTTFSTNNVTSLSTNNLTTFSTNIVTSFTTNIVTSFVTNIVATFTTNDVTSLTTNIVTSFSTNIITSFATNSVASFSTNNVTSLITNSFTSFTTNSVTSLSTNDVTSFTTNIVTSFITNVFAGAITNTVTASGMDDCQGRLVTASTSCDAPGSLAEPLVLGGIGVPSPSISHGNFSFSFPTRNTMSYVVQYETNLSDPVWQDLKTVIGTGGIMNIMLPTAGHPSCWYRIKVSP